MSYKTYGQLSQFVQNKLDLRDEDFIDSTELLEYCEEALKFCEAEIHTLNVEDWYFETSAAIALEADRSTYDLPSNIYGQKITRIIYKDQGDIYQIPRNTRKDRYSEQNLIEQYGASTNYSYMVFNASAINTPQLELRPKVRDTSSTVAFTGDLTLGSRQITNASTTTGLGRGYYVTGPSLPSGTWIESISGTNINLNQPAIATEATESLTGIEDKMIVYYLRKVSIPSATSDLIDYPEFWNFISQHMIVEALKKELGNPRAATEETKLEKLKSQMHSTLSDKVPDQQDEIQSDISTYVEMTDI